MDQQYPMIEEQLSGVSCRFHKNIAENLERYKQLNLAVSLAQKENIIMLLQECESVNHHLLYKNLQTPLHSSVHVGDLEIVKQLLNKGASVNAVYAFDTPLTLAAKFQKDKVTDLLLLAKGLQNGESSEKITHFHVACMRNRVDVAKKLLLTMRPSDVNVAISLDTDYWPGYTALHFAVHFQCIEAVEFLLNVGADTTIKDARQLTPLHLANMLRNTQMIDMILSAHINVVANPVDSKGLSHFHIACTRNNPEVVEYFIKLGVNLEAPIMGKSTQGQKKTAIDLAIHYGCADVVELLLKRGVLMRLPTRDFWQRIRNAYCTANEEIIDILSRHNRLNEKCEKVERLPSHFQSLICDSNEDIEKLLSETPEALKSSIIWNGCTLLHVAIGLRNEQISKYIIIKGADYTIQDFQGKSPLHLAFELNMPSLVGLMLDYHRNFVHNPTDNNGLSHLHIACARNHVKTVEHLLKLGANVDSHVNFQAIFWPGFTPLHFAAEFKCLGAAEVTEVLLQYGASYTATNAANMNAYDIACTHLVKCGLRPHLTDFAVIKSILKCHLRRKDHPFNDRGFSLLHLENWNSCNAYFQLSAMKEAIQANPDHINKAIHGISTRWDGYTPLHFAIQTDSRGIRKKLLLSEGADIFKQALNGDTPLHLSLYFSISAQTTIDPQDFRFLQLNHIGTEGLSFFHLACEEGNLIAMKYFLENGVNPDCPSLLPDVGCVSNTPLHIIVENRLGLELSTNAIDLLLDYGANPNVRSYGGDTPLHLMGNSVDSKVIDKLVDRGADVNARNDFLETPLMSVLDWGRFSFEDSSNDNVASFLYNGADINLVDERGATPVSIDFVNCLDKYPKVLTSIYYLLAHVVKLKTIGSYVSDTNREAYDFILRHLSNELHFVEKTFTEECIKELEMMKQIGIDSYTTLYDILFENPNRSAVSSQNCVFQQIVDSGDFREKYPLYGFMLRLQLKRGQVRWPLLKESREILSDLLNISLPRDCVENILLHLDNEDLRKIIPKRGV